MAGHEGQPRQVTVWMIMTGWVMSGWLSLEALETTGLTQIHARLTETATEKRNTAGQVEYGWSLSPARARRAELEDSDDWMAR